MNTTANTQYPYYSIVWVGHNYGVAPKAYYRSLTAAAKAAQAMRGATNVRIVGCNTVAEAKKADFADASLTVVYHKEHTMNTTANTQYPYYSIVWAGCNYGVAPKAYYRSLTAAAKAAQAMRGATNVRIVGCNTVAEAKNADISDFSLTVVYHA